MMTSLGPYSFLQILHYPDLFLKLNTFGYTKFMWSHNNTSGVQKRIHVWIVLNRDVILFLLFTVYCQILVSNLTCSYIRFYYTG